MGLSPLPQTGERLCWDTELKNQDGTVVATYDVLTMVAKEWAE